MPSDLETSRLEIWMSRIGLTSAGEANVLVLSRSCALPYPRLCTSNSYRFAGRLASTVTRLGVNTN